MCQIIENFSSKAIFYIYENSYQLLVQLEVLITIWRNTSFFSESAYNLVLSDVTITLTKIRKLSSIESAFQGRKSVPPLFDSISFIKGSNISILDKVRYPVQQSGSLQCGIYSFSCCRFGKTPIYRHHATIWICPSVCPSVNRVPSSFHECILNGLSLYA